jgi:hypothetical protein
MTEIQKYKIDPPIIIEIQLIMQYLRKSTNRMDCENSYYDSDDKNNNDSESEYETKDIPNEKNKKLNEKIMMKKYKKKRKKEFMQFWACDDIELALPVFALPNRELYEDDYEDDSRLILPTAPTRELYEDDYEDDSRLILPTAPTRELYENECEDDNSINNYSKAISTLIKDLSL